MQPLRQLSLFDSICILVGIIIGAGIYESTPDVAKYMGSSGGVMTVWLAGGMLALVGSLCYAELATAYPREGGDYVYLTRAFGRWCGGLFGWSQLAIVRPTDIALMAFIFARYANQLWMPLGPEWGLRFWAAILVGVLTVVNILGVRSGRLTQNILVVAKIVGLMAIVGAAIWGGGAAPTAASQPAGETKMQVALILVLFAYGGWNEMAFVAAEVKNPRRNIVRALVISALVVTGLYVLVNGALLWELGFQGMSESKAVAVDAVNKALPGLPAGRIIAAVICISAAGAVNGLIFTGSRITYALGTEQAMFRIMGRWHPRLGTPVMALAIQGAIGMVILLAAGSFVDAILYSAPVVWLFFAGTALSLFVLRWKERQTERPYRVALFPVVPAAFFGCCLFMLYSSVTYAWNVKPKAFWVLVAVMAAGIPMYGVNWWIERRRAASGKAPA